MKRSLKRLVWLPLSLLSVFCFLFTVSRAQEVKETPSQKAKEVIERSKKPPATDSLTLPTKKPERAERSSYSPAGRRDPFRPLALKTKVTPRPRENLSPLERFEVGQLKLVGIVWDIKEPKAMVEDAAGLGYIVKIGTPIGANEGKVKAIKPTEVVIEESYTDFYGARKSREINMKLPVE